MPRGPHWQLYGIYRLTSAPNFHSTLPQLLSISRPITTTVTSMSAAAPVPPRPLAFMEKLHPLVSLYRPNTDSTTADQQPRLVIVSSWTDARDAHIVKYVSKYQVLYPAAQILLLRSTMRCIVRPSQIAPAMKIAAGAVHAAFEAPLPPSSSSSPPLLIHIFSNGGSSSIANLYEQFAATAGPDQDQRLPPHATVFDSNPGLFHLSTSVAFVSVGLPTLQRLVAAPFLYAFALFWTVSMALGVLPNSLREWSVAHNHHPANAAELRRVYVYSPADTLTAYEDVEAHSAEAKTKGFSVALEKFDRSAHVAHVRKDENRYWGLVKKVMEG